MTGRFHQGPGCHHEVVLNDLFDPVHFVSGYQLKLMFYGLSGKPKIIVVDSQRIAIRVDDLLGALFLAVLLE